jgi:hemerythrin-like metal-binding protein
MVGYVTWTDAYSVGDSSLDAEHKQILVNVDQLFLPMQGRRPGLAAERLIDALVEKTRTHFEHEEERLREVAYAAAPAHKLMHDEMMQWLVESRSRLMSLSPADVLRFLRDWWLEHIQVEDKKFAAYLDEVKVWSNSHLCK